MKISFHLENLMPRFESKKLDEDFVENANDTHLFLKLDNGPTLALIRSTEIKYAEFVSR